MTIGNLFYYHPTSCQVLIQLNWQQNGRLATAYFSPNYKYFDQLLKTVKNELLFWIKFSKVFYKHQFHHWFLYFMQKRGVSRSSKSRQIDRNFSVEILKILSAFCFKQFVLFKCLTNYWMTAVSNYQEKFIQNCLEKERGEKQRVLSLNCLLFMPFSNSHCFISLITRYLFIDAFIPDAPGLP